MNEWATINKFWNSFGVPAYDENTVPDKDDKPIYPYITYESSIGYIDDSVSLSASLWDYSKSWNTLSKLLENISEKIGLGGSIELFDRGAIIINRGQPFAQRMNDPESDMIRRIYINIEVMFISNK